MRLKLIFLVLLALYGVEVTAQNRTLKTKSNELYYPDEIARTLVKETYSYYEDEQGNYVKHGSFSAVGKKDENVANGFSRGNQKCNLSLKANYKDGLLHGSVTASRTSTVWAQNNLSGGSLTGVTKENLTGGFSSGVPHGAWNYTNTLNGKTQYSVKMNFNNGVMVGSYLVTADINTGELITTKGELDADGFLIGKWTYLGSVTDRQENYGKGAELSRISRNNQGAATTKEIAPEVKEIALKYANGEVTLEELSKMGYPHLIMDEGKRGYLTGYKLCFSSNYLGLKNLTGREIVYADHSYLTEGDEPKVITGKTLYFSKIGIMTDDLLNIILAKQGLEVEADTTLVANIKSSYYNDPNYFILKTPSDSEKHLFFGYSSYIELSCGDEYPLLKYYMTKEQHDRYKEMRAAHEAEQDRIKKEIVAEKKRKADEFNRAKNLRMSNYNTAKNIYDKFSKDIHKSNIIRHLTQIINNTPTTIEECQDQILIAENVIKIGKLDDAYSIGRFINALNMYDVLINYQRADSMAPLRAIQDTDERREDAENQVKRGIASSIYWDIAELTRVGYTMGGGKPKSLKESDVIASVYEKCDKEFTRVYMLAYKSYNRDSIEDYAIMLEVNNTMKVLHSENIDSYTAAKKAAKKEAVI